jgi:hypothetical protein
LGSVSLTVADTPQTGRTAPGPPDRDPALSAPRTVHLEAVVFPRGGTPLDQRPVDLRKQHATQRYRRDGAPPRKRNATS